MTPVVRIAVATLSLSAAGFGAVAVNEGYRDTAYVPVVGDRWTVGFGSTFWFDGTPVRRGDKIDVLTAIKLKLAHIGVDESAVKKCVTAPVSQKEYDLLVSHAYQYGHAATCGSTLVRLTNERRYNDACRQYARWTFADGRNCRQPNSGCAGVAIRADERTAQCLASQ